MEGIGKKWAPEGGSELDHTGVIPGKIINVKKMKGRINVLHVADKFGVEGSSVHGVSRLFSWWFPRFDEDKFNVELIGLREQGEASKNLEEKGVGVKNLGRSKFDPFTCKDIYKRVKKDRFDILHLHGYGSSNFGRLASLISDTKVIIHEHFVDPSVPIYQRPADYILRNSIDYGIAVSESVKVFMKEDRYIHEDKIEVVYNGAPLEEFQKLRGEGIRREKVRWNIPQEYSVVGTVGRLDEQKGIKFFIEAANEVKRHIEEVKFVVVGDGPLAYELKSKARSLSIEESMVFTGYQADVARVQSMFDVQVFPSLWEGTPLTLFEAMSMGLPIVSTPVDGLGEVLRDNENALLVPTKNSEALAENISRLIKNPSLSQKISDQAKKESSKYSIENAVKKLQKLYKMISGN